MPRHQKRKKPISDSPSVHETVNKKRKKSKDKSIHVSVQQQKSVTTMSKASVDQTKVSSKRNVTTAFSGSFDDDELSYTAVARIRAAFYPKFDNEMPEQKVRKRIVKLVSEGLAALEVSLKHSGSLFMYAGHEGGAYAKNSYGNIYTAVGVFVLHRTFQQAWGLLAEKKQQEFNEFLECNRMCISMELVTAVLGDHGQRPRKDYVTELGTGKPKFYSAPDIIVFCRKWRLPTNHVWLFTTRKSVKSFFAAYDALNEEGTATPVCKALDESNMKSTFQKAHVTLAHIGSHGVTGVASYAHYHHEKVPVHISALLFSDKLAALEVDLGNVDGEKVSSKIEWPHVTLWTAKGTPPREASKLPHLFAEGKETRVKIDSPVTITGTLEFC